MLNYFDIYKNNVYVKNKTIELTYDQALSIIQYYANYFDQHVHTQTIVFVLPNQLESQLLLFAALHVRKVVLINPAMLEISPQCYTQFEPCTVLSFRSLDQECTQLIIDPSQVLENKKTTSFNNNFQSTSLTLLTSGTTGQSKTVVLDAQEIEAYGRELQNYLKFGPQDCILNLLPFYHGFGLTRIFTALATGGSQIIPENNVFKNVIDLINHSGTTWVSLIPAQVQLLNRQSGKLHNNFRFATTSASHCDLTEFQTFRQRFGKELLSEYGCTESSIISSNSIQNNRPGSVGIPKDNLVEIIDGEIFTKPTWRSQPELISTGDLGYVDAENFLWVQGRKKEVIKRNGITLIPQEIELRIKLIHGIVDAVVYVHDSDHRGDLIGVIYVGDATVEFVKKQIATILPTLRRSIISIKSVDVIPTTFNKIKRLELKRYVDQL